MEEKESQNFLFFKFMHDIIESGVWAKLSASGRTLYPVLCKFTDETFKMVWPGTDTLLKLTGFKTKKSLQEARRDLVKHGLISYAPGNGRSSTRYHFRFDYPGSRMDMDRYRDKIISLRGVGKYPPEGSYSISQGGNPVSPKEINININTNYNNQEQKNILEDLKTIRGMLSSFVENGNYARDPDAVKNQFVENLLEKYGELEVGEAVKIAVQKGKNGDIRYLEGILKNRAQPKINPKPPSHSEGDIEAMKMLLGDILRINPGNIRFKHKYNDIYYWGLLEKPNISLQDAEGRMKEAGFLARIYDESSTEGGRDLYLLGR